MSTQQNNKTWRVTAQTSPQHRTDFFNVIKNVREVDATFRKHIEKKKFYTFLQKYATIRFRN